jgi:hypothetical protein
MLRHFENSWLLCGFDFYVEGTWGHKNKNTWSNYMKISKARSINMKMLSTGSGMQENEKLTHEKSHIHAI